MKNIWFVLLVGVTGLLTPLSHANNAPYPVSPVVSEIVWDSEVSRAALGSDNWPLTWGDDDNLYTAWGDGWGFSESGSKKSLGWAKVSGGPTTFVGTDIPSGETQSGGGPSGKKASGLLMVDGTLYMWMRNANQNGEECQLGWSQDHAQNWTFSTWKFSELGYCTFINFGKNYEGARDNYVYMVSHNGPSAYQAADSFILTRVPKDQVITRASYEFFIGLNDLGEPIWTSDINGRGAVFTHSNRCLRSGISYNAALKRYFWWQQIPPSSGNPDTRFAGGFGIYVAPEPWGPWRTAYYTEAWDMGPGETASFPTKWMSEDGLTLFLVFSGDDAFSVRKASVILNTSPDTTPPDPPTGLRFSP